MITSHLQTAYTIIVCDDEELVNKWITTLLYVTSPNDRGLIRFGIHNFIPGLVIQACSSTPSNDLIAQCILPSTIMYVQDNQNVC